MKNKSETLPVPPGYAEPEKLPPFEKTDIATINAFEKELGIAIPQELYESVPMYKFGYYFSSKDGFLGTYSDPEFIELLKDKNHIPLVAFGQTGYGFNSGRFEFYHISNALGYKLNIFFGGAFMNNDAIGKKITKTLAKLPDLIAKYKSSDGKTMTVIFDDGSYYLCQSRKNIDFGETKCLLVGYLEKIPLSFRTFSE
jgi:hypothetical protein